MISDIRKRYNQAFTPERYRRFMDWITAEYDHHPPFKVAETPVFIPPSLKRQLFEACEEITDALVRDDFKERSKHAVPYGQEVPGETPHTTFLQMDFGICKDADGSLIPQLIEVQGFPSLYFYQHVVADAYRRFFDIPVELNHLFNGFDPDSYLELLRSIIIGDSHPENVILLEVEPHKQATQIDFIIGKKLLGMEYLCVSELKKEGKDVYYVNEQGRKIGVEKIYNRVIFDELVKRDDLKREFFFHDEANVEWIGHPNWFFRISKHTLPLLDSRYAPQSYFLNELDEYPEDLQNYVLKPLYSFAGTGVMININRFDLDAIADPENYILQRKVNYAPVVETLDEPAKCEIRMLMLWERNAPRPVIVNNLARLSKGEMIGVRYNKGREWVGGSVGFFPK